MTAFSAASHNSSSSSSLSAATLSTTALGLMSFTLIVIRYSSGVPAQEIGQQGQPRCLALFRMELSADHVVAPHDGGYVPAVIAIGKYCRIVLRHQLEAVDEIGMRAVTEPGEHRMLPADAQDVPAHMRNLQAGLLRGDFLHRAGNPAQPR